MRQLYVYVANKSTQSLNCLTSLGTLQLQGGDKTLCVQIVIRMNCSKFNIQSDTMLCLRDCLHGGGGPQVGETTPLR